MNENELASALEGRAAEEAQTPAEPVVEETPAAAVAETVAEPTPEDPVQQYLAKYGGDSEKALRAAVEAQSLIGRQGQEIGELRKIVEERLPAPQVDEGPQFEPVTDENIAWADEMAQADNWQEAAVWAAQHQPLLYERIISTRGSYDPIAVNRFETALALRAQQQQFAQQLQPVVQPVIQQQLQDQFTTAWNRVAIQNPDINQYTPQLLQIAERNPELLAALQHGTPEAKERVIGNLYLLAKGSAATPLQAAAAQASQEAIDGAAALRQQAAVATQTMAAPAAATRADSHLDSWRNDFREEAGLPPLE